MYVDIEPPQGQIYSDIYYVPNDIQNYTFNVLYT